MVSDIRCVTRPHGNPAIYIRALSVQSVPDVIVRKPPPAKPKPEHGPSRKRKNMEGTAGRSTVTAPASDMQRFFHARSCTLMTEQETRAVFANPRGEPDSDDEEDGTAWAVSFHCVMYQINANFLVHVGRA